MKPSATDIEIRGLSPDGGGSNALMINFMDLLICVYDSRMNFDLAEDDLSLFLKVSAVNTISIIVCLFCSCSVVLSVDLRYLIDT